YRGDLALARGAGAVNIPMIISGTGLIRLEDIVAANRDVWFQAYLPGEADRIIALIDRAARAGVRTLVLTVDTSILGNRENNIRNGFSTPLKPGLRLAFDGMVRPEWVVGTFLRTLVRHGMPYFENSYAERGAPLMSQSVMRDFGARDHLNWAHAELIRRHWKGQFVLKGIMTRDDAVRAHAIGADAIILSNHGGRQLDCTVSPLRILPEVADALKGKLPIMIDSGFRRGSDVLKALALGADFVFVGRPFLYAAAIGGEAGVRHCARILHDEIHRNMGLLGINTPQDMNAEYLFPLEGQNGVKRASTS
ncbi:MAG: alpha-hydroxy acid oxidase, partial [Beijerinckiaceae bacterium]